MATNPKGKVYKTKRLEILLIQNLGEEEHRTGTHTHPFKRGREGNRLISLKTARGTLKMLFYVFFVLHKSRAHFGRASCSLYMKNKFRKLIIFGVGHLFLAILLLWVVGELFYEILYNDI